MDFVKDFVKEKCLTLVVMYDLGQSIIALHTTPTRGFRP